MVILRPFASTSCGLSFSVGFFEIGLGGVVTSANHFTSFSFGRSFAETVSCHGVVMTAVKPTRPDVLSHGLPRDPNVPLGALPSSCATSLSASG